LSFLFKNRKAEKNVKVGDARKLHQSKQEIIHKEIESMRRRRPNATKTELFEALAEKKGKETRML
jgi:ribosomal 50S subunit-recycling heat shock protein